MLSNLFGVAGEIMRDPKWFLKSLQRAREVQRLQKAIYRTSAKPKIRKDGNTL